MIVTDWQLVSVGSWHTCLRDRIHSDYNEDRSEEILQKWASKYASEYHGINYTKNRTSEQLHPDEDNMFHWSPRRYSHVINLRENALNFARRIWADYIFMLDADVFLTNTQALKILVSKELFIVAPMLISDGLYSNFWCGMTKDYYYRRTDDYKLIVEHEKIGCFDVPMVHTAVLISLNTEVSDVLTYNAAKLGNHIPKDDIIAFALSAKNVDVPLHICNDHEFGYSLVPLSDTDYIEKDHEQMINTKLQSLSRGIPFPLDNALSEFVKYPEPWKFECDEIYMINLDRRIERRQLMKLSFKELGMDVKLFSAVDGRSLDINNLEKSNIKLLPNYEDPYHKRPMKAGEVGCFLSHYYIWKEIIFKKLNMTLILEDDVHFTPYFRHRLLQLIDEMRHLDWDLVYIGRKILEDNKEAYVTEHTTRPLYSYWTLGYFLSYRGAVKLVNAEPLSKMLPVDEFLPIMFDQHPNETWKSFFPERNLVAYSAAPLLIHPTHYTGQDGYISDTEDSLVVDLTKLREQYHTEL
ncbi:glycosyltransferase 25 family member isoform X2 [Manduca sexta]|uniref:glycosyltransferase 25 family member isoform X2 n=1 Tax=Manduca sexta TaxID=7130 RepID=UPI00188EDC50|nr:glycosyltransferase 25 family member isoform X2 [Manduca sexta]